MQTTSTRTRGPTLLVVSLTLLVALVSTTTMRTARADGPLPVPVRVGGATAGTLAQESKAKAKPKPKPAAKPTAKAHAAKPAAKPAPKPSTPSTPTAQKVPRNIGPKPEEPAKPAVDAPKEGEESTTGTREEKAGKVDGSKWRPRRRG